MAFKRFEQERGEPVRQVLPDKRNSDPFDFSIGGFSGTVDPSSREMYNPQFRGDLLTVNGIAANPQRLLDAGDAVYEVWEDVFGENLHGASQPDHPGDPPFSTEGLEVMLNTLVEQYELLCADPMLQDLVGAIRDRNYRLAIRFLGAENPELVIDPTSGHELNNLFTNGEIHIVYEDPEIAVLKPEYNMDGDDELMQQQWNARTASSQTMVVGENMRRWAERRFGDIDSRSDINVVESDDPWEGRIVDGEWPQEAFVVGRDDTPVGLFAHSIDGTRLAPDQNVSKAYIQDVMGFDKSYRQEERLDLDIGERVRLQGDLAVEYVSGESVPEAGRCPIPIDNHYVALDSGILPPNETKDVEPITVQIPDGAYLNIAHDEHENVAVELAGGEYEFYLLPRGLQPESERPDWNESDM